MTAATLTLTGFLLARIAEDEAWAVEEHSTGWHPHLWRAQAECEAKRRIVEWHAETEDCCEERLGPLQFEEGPLEAGTDVFGDLTLRQSFATQRHLGCVTLMHLAAVYADHPDYRDEWKP